MTLIFMHLLLGALIGAVVITIVISVILINVIRTYSEQLRTLEEMVKEWKKSHDTDTEKAP